MHIFFFSFEGINCCTSLDEAHLHLNSTTIDFIILLQYAPLDLARFDIGPSNL